MDSSRKTEFTDEGLREFFVIARRLALRWVSDGDADDVAQEAVIRLVKQAMPPENPIGWLFIVTRRISNRQRLRTLSRMFAEESWHRRLNNRVDPDLLLDVIAVLNRLPPRDRRLLLRVIEGASSAEIACEAGCSVKNIGQMVARARRKARRLLRSGDSPKTFEG